MHQYGVNPPSVIGGNFLQSAMRRQQLRPMRVSWC